MLLSYIVLNKTFILFEWQKLTNEPVSRINWQKMSPFVMYSMTQNLDVPTWNFSNVFTKLKWKVPIIRTLGWYSPTLNLYYLSLYLALFQWKTMLVCCKSRAWWISTLVPRKTVWLSGSTLACWVGGAWFKS